MRFPVSRRKPGAPAYVIAQLLDSDILSADAVTKFRAILEREGTELSDMLRPGAQFPLHCFREAYPELYADQAACLGYLAGEQVSLSSNSLLTLPLVSAGSVSDVLRLFAYMPLFSSVINASFLERDDSVLITLTVDSGDPVLDRIPLFYCAAALVQLLRILSSEPLELTIHIAWPQPLGLAEHPECLAGRLLFDAPMHHICVPRSTLKAACRFSDPKTFENALSNLQAMLDSHEELADAASHVKRLLESGPGLIGIDEIASKLNLSVSTLKRRLTKSGTSFRTLMETTLKDRAILLLTDESMPLERIALELGYSDLANFSHAFKRWTGFAPSVFRRRWQLLGVNGVGVA